MILIIDGKNVNNLQKFMENIQFEIYELYDSFFFQYLL